MIFSVASAIVASRLCRGRARGSIDGAGARGEAVAPLAAEGVPGNRVLRSVRERSTPPAPAEDLPQGLLGRFQGLTGRERLVPLLRVASSLRTASVVK